MFHYFIISYDIIILVESYEYEKTALERRGISTWSTSLHKNLRIEICKIGIVY